MTDSTAADAPPVDKDPFVINPAAAPSVGKELAVIPATYVQDKEFMIETGERDVKTLIVLGIFVGVCALIAAAFMAGIF